MCKYKRDNHGPVENVLSEGMQKYIIKFKVNLTFTKKCMRPIITGVWSSSIKHIKIHVVAFMYTLNVFISNLFILCNRVK